MSETTSKLQGKRGKKRGYGGVKGSGASRSDSSPGINTNKPAGDGPRYVKGKGNARSESVVSTATSTSPSATSVEHVATSLASLSLGRARPARPGYGTAGRSTTVRTNFLRVRLPEIDHYYDYSIIVEPKPPGPGELEEIIGQFDRVIQGEEWSSRTVHDRHSRLISRTKLPQPLQLDVGLHREGRLTTYQIWLKFSNVLDVNAFERYLQGANEGYDPLPIISALNLDTQYTASRDGIRIGKRAKAAEDGVDKGADGKARHFWRDLRGNPIALRSGGGLELLRGIFTSVRPSVEGLLLNVNACTMAFYQPGNMGTKLLETQSSAGGIPNLPQSFTSGLRVATTYRGYKQRKYISRIHDRSARDHIFPCAELGGRVSVKDYFEQKYNLTLQQPDLPLIDIGSKGKPRLIPAELCQIEPGTAYTGSFSKFQAQDMLKAACKSPQDNKDFIMNAGLPKFALQHTTRLGLEVSLEMMEIPAREFDPPTVSYRGNSRVSVRDASWNLVKQRFHQGAQVQSWWVLVMEGGRPYNFSGKDDKRLVDLLGKFNSMMSASGLQVAGSATRPSEIIFLKSLGNPNGAAQDIRRELSQRPNKPDFILVLLPRHHELYKTIKRIGDVEHGIHTIHILMDKVLKGPRPEQYLGNVMLKLNSKLGGINHRLDDSAMRWLTEESTMMVGIDVSHPTGGTGVDGAPSVAAVVASVDSAFAQFPASIRIQRGKQEMLHELRDMLIERLQLYQAKNKFLPRRLYVFRDGVSEGQYNIVLDEELEQIREAVRHMFKDATAYPKISVLVCGKRHHARFYPENSNQATRNGNTKPGTVVDRGITSPHDFDFYLQPHAGLQGTVRPTHYVVIYDENNLTADVIQQGTHAASYLYARATKAVSLIPPAYYADIACERGRCYIQEFFAGTRGKGTKNKDALERVFRDALAKWGNGVHEDIKNTMFYL